jgi:hypothetical protein
LSGHLFTAARRGSAQANVKLEPPSRRRPPSFTEAGPYWRITFLQVVDLPRRRPARVTRSPACQPKIDSGAVYFFFRRLVFFAVFFAAAFVFLFFAIAALLA